MLKVPTVKWLKKWLMAALQETKDLEPPRRSMGKRRNQERALCLETKRSAQRLRDWKRRKVPRDIMTGTKDKQPTIVESSKRRSDRLYQFHKDSRD